MKMNEKMFEKMRDATSTLMTSGPAAATIAIQQALQQHGCWDAGEHPAWHPQQSRPMRDITPAPEEATIECIDISDTHHTLGTDKAGDACQPEEAGEPDRFIAGSYRNNAGQRSYKLYVPSSYHGQPLPLMVMLHGCTQDPDDFASGTRMNEIAEEKQCFVVYPAQAQSANSARCWNWFKAIDQKRDQGEPSLIAGITRQVIDTYHIDAKRVYIAGMSAGGAMAVIMGTLYPDLYTAVGVHSGLPYASAQDLPSALAAMKNGPSAYQAKSGTPTGAAARLAAIPIIVFHGDRDSTVHPSNSDTIVVQSAPHRKSQDKHMQSADPNFATTSGKSEPVVQVGKTPNGHAFTRTTYADAQGHVDAEQWLIHGAAHAWSGGSNQGSYTDARGPDASREMMRFFYTQTKKR